MHDMVTNPPHYMHHSGVEVKDITYPLPTWLGSSIKYAMRRDKKGNPIEDRRKAIETMCLEDIWDRMNFSLSDHFKDQVVNNARKVELAELESRKPDQVVLAYMDALRQTLKGPYRKRFAVEGLRGAKELLEDEIERLAS